MNIAVCNSCKESPVHKNKPVVYLKQTDNGYQLIRNNQPYFINGGAAHPDYLKDLKLAGANTARIYDTVNLQATLDKAYKLGLAVVADIPMPRFNTDPQYYEDNVMFNSMKERIRRTIIMHKDHPALLYWNLGNELYYPYMYKRTKFHQNFNSLIDMVHEIDPNHPVSTITIGANKLRVISILTRSPKLDFISFNSFGVLSQFRDKLKPIEPIWKGPFVITEWGINGPWEAQHTSWNVPIEENSTKKAEQIKERYYKYMLPLKKYNSLGSFVFYWGIKNEETLTWYSFFGENKLKTQAVFEMNKIWTNNKEIYPGPNIEYILLNERGATDNIILSPNIQATAKVVLPGLQNKDYKYSWEIRSSLNEEKSNIFHVLSYNVDSINNTTVAIKIPEKEGPYRLYLFVTNSSEYFATANIPFYVLKPNKYE